MPRSRFAGSLSTPKVDVVVDMGNPFLNRTVDGFLKIGTVAVGKVAVEEVYHIIDKEESVQLSIKMFYANLHQMRTWTGWRVSKHNFEHSLKKMCKEGAYWGTIAGVYVGMEYGVARIRGSDDWKTKMIGGALTGALVSAAGSGNREKMVLDAITGGAIAIGIDFLDSLT
ncbi:Outer envelope pore protein 16-1, chloroplastic-like protein [Drosera capensis]